MVDSKITLKSDQFTYEYSKKDVLGEGAWGKVVKALRKEDGLVVAIKFIPQKTFKSKTGNILDRLFHNEKNFVTKINNRHVIRIYEYFNDEENRYQVLELINGKTLEEFFEPLPLRRLEESKVIDIMKQILAGFRGIHEQNIIHRDLKLENIMWHKEESGELIIKIIDFGFCKALDDQNSITKTNLGNDATKAPEVYKGKYGVSADLYGLGCIFYEMLYGDYLFVNLEDKKNEEIEFKVEVNVSKEVKELIRKMTKFEVSERITFEELYETKIFKENIGSTCYHNETQNKQDPILQLYQMIQYLLEAISSTKPSFSSKTSEQVQKEAFWMIYKLIANKTQKLLEILKQQKDYESTEIIEAQEQLEMDLIIGSSGLKQPWKALIKSSEFKENTFIKEKDFQNEVNDLYQIVNEKKFLNYYQACTQIYFSQLSSLQLNDNIDYLQHLLRIKNTIDVEKLISFEFKIYNGQFHSKHTTALTLKEELPEVFQ